MRRFVVDTDTAADDAWAIVEALRAEDICHVEAITTVAGNLPVQLCARNALLAEDAAGTYCPPVYVGAPHPEGDERTFFAFDVHGDDGLGGIHLEPRGSASSEPAVEAIRRIVLGHPGEIEIVTIGPLTNLAAVINQSPDVAKALKRAWILGGSMGNAGNMTDAAEYNVYCDPVAADTVFSSCLRMIVIPWDASLGEAQITEEDMEHLMRSGDRAAQFCYECIQHLKEYEKKTRGENSFGVIDSVLMTAALYPEIMLKVFSAQLSVCTDDGPDRGHVTMQTRDRRTECLVCPAIDAGAYKEHLLRLLGAN